MEWCDVCRRFVKIVVRHGNTHVVRHGNTHVYRVCKDSNQPSYASRVTHMNESCHTCERVVSHV